MARLTRHPAPTSLAPINFLALAAALLDRATELVPQWLAGGRLEGGEWKCGSVQGGKGSSCSVNLSTGKWADFAAGQQGGDLLSLYAAVHGLEGQMGKAAVACAREYGLEDVAGVLRGPRHVAPPRPPAPPPVARPPKVDEGWKTVKPVPAGVPTAKFDHHHRDAADIEHVAEYRHGEQLMGYVVRFRTSTGGKDSLPRTWCVSERDGAAKWHWRQWDEPRPLYLPDHELPQGRTVVLVEGERKADTLQATLEAHAPGVYCVASWPGGSKVWSKADWSPLSGAAVLLWPDCDAKREKLSSAERKALPDPLMQEVAQADKPLLAAHLQPGMMAMLGIGRMLEQAHGCRVELLPIPAPGQVADGWDCRDAIETDGWTGTRVLEFFGQAQPLPADSGSTDEPAPDGKKRDPLGVPPSPGDGGAAGDGSFGDEDDEFEQYLSWLCDEAKIKRHELGMGRSQVIAALRKAPLLRDCLVFDELRGGPTTRVAWPWRSEPGPVEDDDDLQLSDWLVRTYRVRSAGRAALSEAIETVAGQRRHHPFRDWLTSLEWDGTPRLEKWLIHVLRHDVATLPVKLRRYLEMVGKFVLLGHVARVMEPGCKFDYSVVLEGLTGMRKSTLVEVLIGSAFFSDTHFDIGAGKDGMEQLSGILAYELSEMTAFRRADSEAVKQFFSTKKDRYRGAYQKYVKDHPRQCVIWCSTNKRQYLYDLTGNRRFWPVWVGKPINTDWIRAWRGQLFAEAYHRYLAGEPNYPDPEAERLYFRPEQEKRLVQTSVQARLYDLLTRDGAPGGEMKSSVDINVHCSFVTLDKLVVAVGVDPGKSNLPLEGQVRDWLLEHGWTKAREGGGQRRWGFRRPDVWPPLVVLDEDEGDEPDGGSMPPQAGGNASDSGPPHEEGDDASF